MFYQMKNEAVCERLGVGARVGAVTQDCVVFSQARTDPRLHDVGLANWRETKDATATLNAMKHAAKSSHWRQLGVLAITGPGLHYTGASCLPECGGIAGANSLALGNFLGSPDVLSALIETFESQAGTLSDRLIAAMLAGEAAGSERDPLQSAAIIVQGADNLKDVDLRIDASTDPLGDLKKLMADWMPKAAAYRLRAEDPDAAPSSSDVERK